MLSLILFVRADGLEFSRRRVERRMFNHNHTDTFLLDPLLSLNYQLFLPLPELLLFLSNVHRLDLQKRYFS